MKSISYIQFSRLYYINNRVNILSDSCWVYHHHPHPTTPSSFCLVVLKVKPRALRVVSKTFTTEKNHSPFWCWGLKPGHPLRCMRIIIYQFKSLTMPTSSEQSPYWLWGATPGVSLCHSQWSADSRQRPHSLNPNLSLYCLWGEAAFTYTYNMEMAVILRISPTTATNKISGIFHSKFSRMWSPTEINHLINRLSFLLSSPSPPLFPLLSFSILL